MTGPAGRSTGKPADTRRVGGCLWPRFRRCQQDPQCLPVTVGARYRQPVRVQAQRGQHRQVSVDRVGLALPSCGAACGRAAHTRSPAGLRLLHHQRHRHHNHRPRLVPPSRPDPAHALARLRPHRPQPAHPARIRRTAGKQPPPRRHRPPAGPQETPHHPHGAIQATAITTRQDLCAARHISRTHPTASPPSRAATNAQRPHSRHPPKQTQDQFTADTERQSQM
jgi:hypothetical protein